MTFKLPVLVFTLIISSLSLTAQIDTVRLKQYVDKAMEYMDRNLPDEAIRQWDLALTVRPDYTPYEYEKVLCYVMAERYDEAIEKLTPIYKNPDLFDRGYQLLGNCYDQKDDSVTSISIYRAGLQSFPTSGRLHYELGAAALISGDIDSALHYWVLGTKVEPRFATNYFWICKGLAKTEHRFWAAMYGEAFLNLEPGGERFQEVSKLVFQIYNASMSLGSDDPINFCTEEVLSEPSPYGANSMNFGTAFELGMALASQRLIPEEGVKNTFTLQELIDIRQAFLKGWQKSGYLEKYKNDLFSWQYVAQQEGYLKEYLRWIMSYGSPDEMRAYYAENSDRYDLFFAWLTQTGGMPFNDPVCLGISCTD